MRIGKIFLLSKDEGTQFPVKPNIRAIMVQNMITKMFELTLQQEMQKEWKRLEILSKKQRGGIGQRSVYDNLLDVFIHIDHAKKQQEAYRREKKKVDDVIARELEAHAKEQGDAGDLLNIAPRKPNWDLKRDLSTKMEKLNKRTKYAIVELIKQRIEAESNADEDDET